MVRFSRVRIRKMVKVRVSKLLANVSAPLYKMFMGGIQTAL